jgi:uncharacterized membrane protein
LSSGRNLGEQDTEDLGEPLGLTRSTQARLIGIDVARMLAIMGMIMVHFGPNPVPDTRLGTVYEVAHGRASILFVLLAGVGISYLFQSASRQGRTNGYAQILVRGAILLPVGLWLQQLDHGVLVILQFYAIYFLFGAIIAGLPRNTILVIGILSLALGPIMYEFAEQQWPQWFVGGAPEIGDPATSIVRDLLISGYYPLVTWAAPLSIGIWLGKQDLRSTRNRLAIILIGTVAAFGSSAIARIANAAMDNDVSTALSNDPHSQTHLWLIGATGSAMLVLGICLFVAERAPSLVWPLAAAGQLALTIYVGHLILLHSYADLLRYDQVESAFLSVAVFMSICAVVATLWRRFFSHGPLEALFRLPSWLMRQN